MNDYGIAYYETKARGGAAMVTIGDTPVEPLYGATQYNSFQLDDPGALSSLSQVAAAIKQYGAIPSLELSHGGAISSPAFNQGNAPIGPSAFTRTDGVAVREMDQQLIDYIIAQYAQGAKIIKKAGFEMCTIHAGHGWLLSQFLSPRTNHRQDAYGGSLENRARLTIQVVDAVRAACGKSFLIELRISGAEFVEDGFHLEDMIQVCSMLKEKVDLIHVSAGVHGIPSGLMRMFPSNLAPHGLNVYLASEIKKATGLPVAAVGGISNPEEAEEIIASGQADFVALGRALIADPDFPNKVRRGQKIRPCLHCLNCLNSMNISRHLTCAVNPAVGIEHRFAMPPKGEKKKRVLVIGGGPGGMTAAVTAARQGHQVVLCEAGDVLGGLLRHAEADPRKADLKAYMDYLIHQVSESNVKVLLGTNVDKAFIENENADAVICAIGSEPFIPPIPGIEGGNVITAMEAHEAQQIIGERVVIIGGGLVGCETALWLADQGKQVTLLEMLPGLASEDAPLHRMALLSALMPKVTVGTGHRCVQISPEGVVAENPAGNTVFFPADTVICSAGMRAKTEEVDALDGIAEEFYPVGDCNRARRLRETVSEAYFAALYL